MWGVQASDELDRVDSGFYPEAELDFGGEGEGKGAPQASGGTGGLGRALWQLWGRDWEWWGAWGGAVKELQGAHRLLTAAEAPVGGVGEAAKAPPGPRGRLLGFGAEPGVLDRLV